MMAKYVRLTKGLADFGILIPPSNISINVTNDTDYYTSVYYYNDEHLAKFRKDHSVKGITDVVTDKLVFDFDNEQDPSKSQKDAIEIVSRLVKTFSIGTDDIEMYFSGNKGFSVILNIDKLITPKQHEAMAADLAQGLLTFDPSLYDANQILRVPNTKHNKSGLYKISLNYNQLSRLTIPVIKDAAKKPGTIKKFNKVHLPETFFEKHKEGITVNKTQSPMTQVNVSVDLEKLPKNIKDIDLTKKPSYWKDYKWSLLQGNFNKGERRNAMMSIAATCRGLGYDRELTRFMLHSANEKHCSITNNEKETDNIDSSVESVFSEGWNGGQYSYKNNLWLRQYCLRLGVKVDEKDTDLVEINEIEKYFEKYAENFEDNIVATGIKDLDDNVMFLAGTHNGLLGQPGSGKTSLAIQWLMNASKNGIHSFFYSLDMSREIIYAKLVQSTMGIEFREAIKLKKTDPVKYHEAKNLIREKFKNVKFNFTSGTTPEKIKNDIKNYEQSTGSKVRLLVVDYLECIQGPYSDQTANTGFISNQMKDLANELIVCSVMLLQTQKNSIAGGDVSEPLLSMKQIKGSSVIEQSSSVVLTLWREGYSPRFIERDRYISFASVKNRFGSLWTDDFSWNAKRGEILGSLTDEERESLERLREDKKRAKQQVDEEWD